MGQPQMATSSHILLCFVGAGASDCRHRASLPARVLLPTPQPSAGGEGAGPEQRDEAQPARVIRAPWPPRGAPGSLLQRQITRAFDRWGERR